MPEDLACIDAVELVTEYLEGALPAEDVGRLERHLETCPGCAEYVDQMRALAGSLEGLGGDTLAAQTRAALIAAFRDRNA
jgi:anti-sigma factor RsiW